MDLQIYPVLEKVQQKPPEILFFLSHASIPFLYFPFPITLYTSQLFPIIKFISLLKLLQTVLAPSKNGYLENMECGILEWNGVEWIGLEWTGMDWNGLEWTGMALLIDFAVIVARTVENDT